MNALLEILQNDDSYFLLAALVAVSVMIGLGKGAIERQRFARRVKSLKDHRAQLKAALITTPRKRKTKGKARHNTAFIHWINNFVRSINPVGNSREQVQHLLINAGYRSKDALVMFGFFQLITPVIMLIIAIFLLKIDWNNPFGNMWKITAIPAILLVGLRFPHIMVMNVRTKRYIKIQRALADTLDLMIICTEAGLSLAAALDRVAKELNNTYPEMAEELEITSVEIGFLPERKKGLLNLADRVDIPEIRGIINVLIQTEKYGTPLSQSLRTLSTEFRVQRMLRAEQKAAQLPAIMTVPMILFILPTLFIVIIAPAVINSIGPFSKAFSH